VSTRFAMHTKAIEQEVIAFFAKLFRATENDYWGYVTSGSTECNLFALYMARQKFPEATVYYSAAAHYSIPKNIHILAMKGVAVPTLPSGEMNYAELERLVRKQPGKPVIVIATIGTTMTEAKDNVKKIVETLQAAKVPEYYIHADAALAGPYAALLRPRHSFDFADGADSLNISGHKFFGSPMPSGVIIVRKEHRERLQASSNYTGSIDTTISGSRNGHTVLFLWYAIHTWGVQGIRKRAQESQKLAHYAHLQLQKIGWDTWRCPGALTVMLASPPEELIVKWQLATADGWSHIICMPGVTESKVDRFVADLAKSKQRG